MGRQSENSVLSMRKQEEDSELSVGKQKEDCELVCYQLKKTACQLAIVGRLKEDSKLVGCQ